jgi:hypothetical protein
MKSGYSRTFLPVGIALALGAVSLTSYLAKAQSNAAEVNDMTGSWLFNLSRTVPSPLQFLTLATFSKEGTFLGTAQGDGICCPTEGPAHGVWTKTGHDTFAATFDTLWHQADASLFGVLTVNLTLILDQKSGHVTGQFSGQLVGPSGNVIFPLQGTLTGQRMRIQ